MVETVRVTYGSDSAKPTNVLGQRPMQARAYALRSKQFLLLKSPPASGKSRALMFIALDKMRHQGISKTIVCVPETTIGGSFRSTNLSVDGFEADWVVEDKWNLCLSEGESDQQKVKAFRTFMESKASVMICTHATFRFGVDAVIAEKGVEAFDGVFIGVDEFHHVSASDNNRLGTILRQLIQREKCHVMAMTGSYFRGDGDPVLRNEDVERFSTVTFSYYEQMDGYEYLKSLGINYQFYKGKYINGLKDVLDTRLKTIIHIPHRGSSEAYDEDKNNEVGRILDLIGTLVGRDKDTGFDLIETEDGRILKVADLVNDGPGRQGVKAALSREILGPDGRRDDAADRDKVDIIIALNMAKEGFDWVWCEHALTIGYRSSLTEIVQIIGRATRDAPGKRSARFTNLVAEPGVETSLVTDAVNDMLKAISGSLLMEQVLAPNFRFYRREDGDIREPFEVDSQGNMTIGIKGAMAPPTVRAREICEEDMHDLLAAACQEIDCRKLASNLEPGDASQLVLHGIVERRYENQTDEVKDYICEQLSMQMGIMTLVRREQERTGAASELGDGATPDGEDVESAPNSLLSLVKKFINVREIDIELIGSVNAFRERFEVLSKALDSSVLGHVQSAMVALRVDMTEEEARMLWPRITAFRRSEGREPNVHSSHALEKRMAEALAWLRAKKAKRQQGETS